MKGKYKKKWERNFQTIGLKEIISCEFHSTVKLNPFNKLLSWFLFLLYLSFSFLFAEAGEEKEACNGNASEKNEGNEEAPSSGEKSDQNGGSAEDDAGQTTQDGDAAGEENNESDKAEEAGKEEENTAEATDSENAESREKNEEEIAE